MGPKFSRKQKSTLQRLRRQNMKTSNFPRPTLKMNIVLIALVERICYSFQIDKIKTCPFLTGQEKVKGNAKSMVVKLSL